MEKDLTKKRGLSDNCRYADLINGQAASMHYAGIVFW